MKVIITLFVIMSFTQLCVAKKNVNDEILCSHKISQTKEQLPYSAPDGRFEKRQSGVILDMETGIEWLSGKMVDTSYYKAREWVYNLNIEESEWRLPTAEELETLRGSGFYYIYPEQDSKKYSLKIHPIFELNECCVWTRQVPAHMKFKAHYVNFGFEEEYFFNDYWKSYRPNVHYYTKEHDDSGNRVFAVKIKK